MTILSNLLLHYHFHNAVLVVTRPNLLVTPGSLFPTPGCSGTHAREQHGRPPAHFGPILTSFHSGNTLLVLLLSTPSPTSPIFLTPANAAKRQCNPLVIAPTSTSTNTTTTTAAPPRIDSTFARPPRACSCPAPRPQQA